MLEKNNVRCNVIIFIETINEVYMSPGRTPSVPSPILLRLPLPGWRGRVLALDPMPRAARAVVRAQTLRHDALEAHLAGVAENDVARFRDVFVEQQARLGVPQEGIKHSLK